MHLYNFFVCGPKFTRFLLSNVGGAVVDNFSGRAFRKLYARYHPCLAPRRLEKFHEDIPTSPEVLGARTVNFKPNFKFSRLQFLGDPIPR